MMSESGGANPDPIEAWKAAREIDGSDIVQRAGDALVVALEAALAERDSWQTKAIANGRDAHAERVAHADTRRALDVAWAQIDAYLQAAVGLGETPPEETAP